MGGTKPTMEGLGAAVRANITITIDRRANDKDRVRVDVVWTQESVNDPRNYVGIQYRFRLRACMCIYTHKCRYTHTGKFDMIIYYSEKGCHIQMLRQTNTCWYHPQKAKGYHLGNARAKTAKIVVRHGYRLCNLILALIWRLYPHDYN